MRIDCLQHVPFEGPAAIADWAAARGHELHITRLYAGEPLPPPGAAGWCLVMGGPMNVHEEDRYPWLAAEKAYLRAVLGAGRTVIGVCLGAQLLADVLGAAVRRGRHAEIGWFPLELTAAARGATPLAGLPDELPVFHWHGDTFELPAGAMHLAGSEACTQQAFLYAGRVLGLQCHLEVTPESVRALVEHCGEELVPAPYVQSAEDILAADPQLYREANAALFRILDALPGAG